MNLIHSKLLVVCSCFFHKDPLVSVLFIGCRLLPVGFVRFNDEAFPLFKSISVLYSGGYKLFMAFVRFLEKLTNVVRI